MRLPSRPMMALRLLATAVLSAVIGQAGWAAAGLGDDEKWFTAHEIGARVTILLCLVTAAVYVHLRRNAGPVNTVLAVVLAAAVACQYALGEAEAKAPHIFLGVLVAMLTTALTSWTYRHDDGGPPVGPGGHDVA